MSKCLICDKEIIEGSTIPEEMDSAEHIIPRAIGGRSKVKGLLHKSCNAKSGETWDAELANQLHPLSHMLQISRQGNDVSPINVTTSAGERITISLDGSLSLTKPVVEKTTGDGGVISYRIVARTMAEASRKLNELKRKYPQVDVDHILANIQEQASYLQGFVKFELGIGGDVSGRSIVKSCISMAFKSGIGLDFCEDAVAYIRDPGADPCFGYYNATDLLANREPGMPIHCLAVHANPSSKLVLAYAEYFGIYKVISCLGRNYTGVEIKQCYALDPRNGSEEQVEVNLPFKVDDLERLYNYELVSGEATKASADAVLGPVMERKRAQEWDRAINQAVDRGFRTCGARPGDLLTEEHVTALCKTVAAEMAGYILNLTKPRQPPF